MNNEDLKSLVYYMRAYFKLIDLVVSGKFKDKELVTIHEIREMVEQNWGGDNYSLKMANDFLENCLLHACKIIEEVSDGHPLPEEFENRDHLWIYKNIRKKEGQFLA